MMTPPQTLLIDGIRLEASADGRTWTYHPVPPVIERDERGRPSLSLVEAGPVAFLQCTVRVALNEDDHERLFAALKGVAPNAETLTPTEIVVERVTLEIQDGAAWTTVAEGRSAGAAPWRTALAATLTPPAVAAIKAAAGGAAGHARLRAWVTRPAAPTARRHMEAAQHTSVERNGRVETSGYTVMSDQNSPQVAAQSFEIADDIAHQLPAPTTGDDGPSRRPAPHSQGD